MRTRLLNARTPDEVFFDREIRIPRREPDESFGYLFFDPVENGRIVGNNGVLYDGRVYRLVSLQKHLEYWGERVDMRVNPDDQREAMIYDRRTGAYVCKALVDVQDATYDTQDEVTRNLIGRVFSDGKELKRMAKSFVEGAKDRLSEYRRAKIDYLIRRASEIESARKELRAATDREPAVTVIGKHSAVARDEAQAKAELSVEVIAEILDADERSEATPATPEAPRCVVSTRKRQPKVRTGRTRRDGSLRYDEIARRLGTTRRTLNKYRDGTLPWPPGMKDRFDEYERLRAGDETDRTRLLSIEPEGPRRTRGDGELSYGCIAASLGMSRKMLFQCRTGARPWPDGMKDRFDVLERLRRR